MSLAPMIPSTCYAKTSDYFYDQDPIRDPLISSGGQKPDAVDRDTRTDFRVYNNPLGRNSGSVWRINSSNTMERTRQPFRRN